MASRRSLYDVLNVSPDAEPVVIEAAYRALMKKYHPDQAPAAGVQECAGAAEINQAFATLRDPDRRADYDRREATRQQAFRLMPAPAAPQHQSAGAFGWAGWLVALLLGALLYVTINSRGGVVQPPAGGAKAAASAEPDHRSQPVAIETPFTASSRPSAVDREILAAEARRLQAREAPPAPADDDPAAALVGEPEPAAAGSTSTRPRARQATQRRRPGQASQKSEEDFLAREGYIY